MSAAGSSVVIALAGARKVVQLYPDTHAEFERAVAALVDAVAAVTDEGSFTLNWHLGRIYDGSTVVPSDLPGVSTIAEAFEVRSVESLTFERGFDRSDAIGLLGALSARTVPDTDFAIELTRRGVDHVAVASIAQSAEESEKREKRERTREQDRALYYRLLAELRAVMSQLSAGASADLAGSKDLVESLLGRLMEDRAAVLGLATIRGAGERALFHSLNVMIYTSVLGQRLGLPEESMVALGTAALLHDIGKSEFDQADESVSERMRMSHPEIGAQLLEQLALQDPGPMLVAYEHHMNVDGTGFPDRPGDYVAHPYSRMVAVANRFENLTNPTNGGPVLTPDRAMVELLKEATHTHDPFFARLFGNAMGVFPVGCVVRLSDNSVGIVSEPGIDPLAPAVRLTHDNRGFELEVPDDVSLHGTDVRIVEVIDPDALDVAVADKL